MHECTRTADAYAGKGTLLWLTVHTGFQIQPEHPPSQLAKEGRVTSPSDWDMGRNTKPVLECPDGGRELGWPQLRESPFSSGGNITQ
jgi:hypothetical protein